MYVLPVALVPRLSLAERRRASLLTALKIVASRSDADLDARGMQARSDAIELLEKFGGFLSRVPTLVLQQLQSIDASERGLLRPAGSCAAAEKAKRAKKRGRKTK